MAYTFAQLNDIAKDIDRVRAIIEQRDVLKQQLESEYKDTLINFWNYLEGVGVIPEYFVRDILIGYFLENPNNL